MPDVSYSTLQSQIGEQQSEITSQRAIIRQQTTAGEHSIESLKRVHPRTPPSVWFGERKPQIEQIHKSLGELTEAEKELVVAEQKLSEQEQLLETKKKEGWKIREKDGGYEFYKEVRVSRTGVDKPSGDFSIRVKWQTSTGEIKSFLSKASNLDTVEEQIQDRGGQIIEVESLGGGREHRTPEMRTTTGGSFILFEAPIIKKEVKKEFIGPVKPDYVADYPVGTTFKREGEYIIATPPPLTVDQYIESKGGLEKFKKSLSSEELLEVAAKFATKGGIYRSDLDEKFWREYAQEKISKTPLERRELYYRQLPVPIRSYSAFFKATISATAFPITLPQTVVKYVTGKGELADPLRRIGTGKTLLFPDVAKAIHKRTPPAPSGIIGIGISEGIGKLTGHEVGEFERAKKYPVETAFATGGEILGLLIGGKAVQSVKVATGKVLTKLKVPEIPLRYGPIQIARKGYWRGRTRLGIGEKVEGVFKEEALSGGLSYAPGKTSVQRIGALKSAFEKTKITTGTGEEFFAGVHATERLWLKPFAILRKGRESPGVSFAPVGEGAPRFLRITGKRAVTYETGGVSLVPQVRLPTAPFLYFKKLKDIPKALQRTSYEQTGKIIKAEKGVFIAPKMYKGGAEYEVIVHGIAKRLGVRSYSEIEGVVVPHPEFKFIEKIGTRGALSSIKESSKRFLSLTSSYAKPPSIPIISPSYLISSIGFVGSRTPSVPSISIPSVPSYVSKPSKVSYPSTPSVPNYPLPPPLMKADVYGLFGHTRGQGYNVKIRERHIVKGKKVKEGRFKKINKRPLSLKNAESLRGMLLDNTAAASGKIVPVNAMAQEPLIDLKPFEDIQHKFYMKDDVLIEKRKHRIDTKGEVKGISALGWYSEKTKKAIKRKQTIRKTRKVKETDIFDSGMDNMLIDMDKIFKGVFDIGF